MEPGIYPGMSKPDKFWARVEKTETCWLWLGSKTTAGYGNLRWNGGHVYAHRLSYELAVDAIPAGLVIDHLCRVRHCVNPAHLEPVEAKTNVQRGLAAYGLRATCKRGHDISAPSNVRIDAAGYRQCRACDAIRRQNRRRAA